MSNTRKFYLALWSVVVLASLVLDIRTLTDARPIETSLLALLPPAERNPDAEAAAQAHADRMSRMLVFLVQAPDADAAVQGAKALGKQLRHRPDLFARVTARVSAQHMKNYYDTFFPWRWQVLSAPHRQQLDAGHDARLIDDAIENLYAPVSGPAVGLLEDDPLFLFSDFVRRMPGLSPSFSLHNGYLISERADTAVALVTCETTQDPFGVHYAGHAVDWLTRATAEAAEAANSDQPVLWTGMLKYARDSAKMAQKEVSVIGTGSMLGIVLLLLLIYRSPRLLVLGLLPLGVGVAVAFAVTTVTLGTVHMLTLVFGATLAGICIDYSLHAFSAFAYDTHKNLAAAIKHIFSAVSFGMISSMLGFLCLLIAPFPGLRQMAFFSAVGLLAAWSTVVLIFPLFPLPQRTPARAPLKAMTAYLSWTQRPRPRWALPVALVLLLLAALPGILRLDFNDNINLLRNDNPQLTAEEDAISELLGASDKSRFILVQGRDAESLLQREEQVVSRLHGLVATQQLGGFLATSQVVPSAQRQQQDVQRLKALVRSDAAQRYRDLLDAPNIFATLRDTPADKGRYLSPPDLLDQPAYAPYRNLWFPDVADGVASLILLENIRDPQALQAAIQDIDHAFYLDRVQSISDIFRNYRWISAWLLLGAYTLVFALLLKRYGLRRGLSAFATPLLTAAVVLAVTGYTGLVANLFTFMGLMLTLGISIDYTIFYSESSHQGAATGVGILLAAITTMLSFGLLSLSATPALHAFGLTVLTGILTALLLAPFGKRPHSPKASANAAAALPAEKATPVPAPASPASPEAP
ncbi:MAG: MMPL family transporter [Myxococcales bacterium]|nr:MMPL family transporter [Myxococcales bacterium]